MEHNATGRCLTESFPGIDSHSVAVAYSSRDQFVVFCQLSFVYSEDEIGGKCDITISCVV